VWDLLHDKKSVLHLVAAVREEVALSSPHHRPREPPHGLEAVPAFPPWRAFEPIHTRHNPCSAFDSRPLFLQQASMCYIQMVLFNCCHLEKTRTMCEDAAQKANNNRAIVWCTKVSSHTPAGVLSRASNNVTNCSKC